MSTSVEKIKTLECQLEKKKVVILTKEKIEINIKNWRYNRSVWRYREEP